MVRVKPEVKSCEVISFHGLKLVFPQVCFPMREEPTSSNLASSQLTLNEILLCLGAHVHRAGEDGFVTRTPVLAGQIMKGSIFSTEHDTSTDGLIAETAIINYSLSFADQAKQTIVFRFCLQ